MLPLETPGLVAAAAEAARRRGRAEELGDGGRLMVPGPGRKWEDIFFVLGVTFAKSFSKVEKKTCSICFFCWGEGIRFLCFLLPFFSIFVRT